VNARWERLPDADRQAAERCAATLAKLSAGGRGSVRELIEDLRGAAGAETGPIVAQLVEATRQVAAAWSALFDRTGRQAAARVRPLASAAPTGAPTLKVIHEHLRRPAANEPSLAWDAAPVLSAFVLGPFRALLDGHAIEAWSNCRGKAIFKYLLLNRRRPVARAALMERFWPEAEPEAARNSLNVAIHRLRRVLGRNGFPFVLFADGHYQLNPKLEISIDADEFVAHAARGSELERDHDVDGAIREYSACIALYQGELLAEERHDNDEWLLPLRQQLRDRYLQVLDRLGRIHFDRQDLPSCTTACAKLIAVDACNEGAHRMLMRCYGRLGHPQLAQQQYQACIQALNRELGVPANRETTDLYREIVRRDAV
jgi:DNA-binding SARP family transcriptional activator